MTPPSNVTAMPMVPEAADAAADRKMLPPHVQARIVNLRCGADIKAQPITWLWPGWLPAGKLALLAGAAGTGKTTLSLAVAATITCAGRWPDGTQCRQKGNVLIWSSEDSPEDTLVPRLIASGADLKRCHFIEGITENGERRAFDPSVDIHELHKAVEGIGGVSLLIIDPIVSTVAGDMYRPNEVRRSLQAVVDFGEIHGCAILGISHFAKGGAGKTPQDRVIGSQAFGALARMVLVAAKEEGSARRVMARAKSNIADDNGGVAYTLEVVSIPGEIETTHVVWDGIIEGTAREILGDVEHDDNADCEQDDLAKLLTDLLTEAGGSMPAKAVKAEISDAGYSWTSANRAKTRAGIESAKERGTKTGSWVWYLPASNHKKPEESAQNNKDSCVSSVVSSINKLRESGSDGVDI